MKKIRKFFRYVCLDITPWFLATLIFLSVVSLIIFKNDDQSILGLVCFFLILVIYNQIPLELSTFIKNKPFLNQFGKRLKLAFNVELIIMIAFTIIYIQLSLSAFGEFKSTIDYVVIPLAMIVTFLFFTAIILFVLGQFYISSLSKKINYHLYWNVLSLLLIFLFWDVIIRSRWDVYILFYILLLIISAIYIIRLYSDLSEMQVSNKMHLVLLTILVSLFICNMVVVNYLIYIFEPNSFGFSANQVPNLMTIVYYTIINATSVGFGDVYPISITAKLSSIITSIFGYFLLFSLIGTIISNQILSKSPKMS